MSVIGKANDRVMIEIIFSGVRKHAQYHLPKRLLRLQVILETCHWRAPHFGCFRPHASGLFEANLSRSCDVLCTGISEYKVSIMSSYTSLLDETAKRARFTTGRPAASAKGDALAQSITLYSPVSHISGHTNNHCSKETPSQ